jgi:energy-coupling factor transporter ATP-binding protein EcfA2
MYIDKVRLTNIRGFRDLEFSFDRGNGTYAGWTVLTGDNGSGKSTVLKAMALSLIGLRAAGGLQPSFRRWVHSGEPRGVIAVDGIHGQQKRFDVAIRLLENDGHPEPTLSDSFGPVQPEQFKRLLDRPDDWFACGYGPFRRVSSSSPEAHALMASPTTERFVTMFQESASLAETDQWLRQLNYKRLEGKLVEAQTLELVTHLLNDEFLPNQIRVKRVDSDGLWLEDRNGVELSWSEMSDGYRSALALLSDILRHLINHYGIGDLATRDADGKLFITRSGVVLIDEIDAHLHPEWQREIGFWLKKRFPNIQFIVTSHSPLICQAADPNGLFVLPEPGSDEPARALTPEEYQEVITSKSDTILRSPAFGLRNTRSDMVVEKRARYSRLQSRLKQLGSLPEPDQQELVELSRYINPDEEP